MSKPAIIFENVSKSYQLKHHIKHDTIKDAMLSSIRRRLPFGKQQNTPMPDDTFWALKDISFEIQPGESVGIIGPNGSGKSTSLKILSGVTQPTSGRYELNGRLGALLEVGAGFHPDLSGRENVYMNGSILGMSKAEIDRKFDSIVDFSELERFIDTPVKHYSSGMYVRLGFAVAIHNEPEIMLVDEALAVGDLAFQKKCFDKIHDIIKSGRTFILVSHAMNQIQETCSRAILLNKGELVADGNPIDITEKYISLSGPPRDTSSNNKEHIKSVIIQRVKFVDKNDEYTSTIATGDSITLDIYYMSAKPIKNPSFTVNIYRGPVQIYSCDTHRTGILLGIINGESILRCTINKLPLIPNSFDIEVSVWLRPENKFLGYSKFKDALIIAPPENPLDIGGYISPEKFERAITYSNAKWTQL